MKRREFLKLPVIGAGAVLLPSAVAAAKPEVPETQLQVVQAWSNPAGGQMQFVAEFPDRIVSMTVHAGKLFVATEKEIYLIDDRFFCVDGAQPPTAVADSGNVDTYAGIDRAKHAWWKSR